MSYLISSSNHMLTRTASTPANLNFSACGWMRITAVNFAQNQILRLEQPGAGTYGMLTTGSVGNALAVASQFGSGGSVSVSGETVYFVAISSAAEGTSGALAGYYSLAGAGSLTALTSAFSSTQTPTALWLGGDVSGNYFNGELYNWKIWSGGTVLSSAQFLAERDSYSPVISANLWAHYPLVTDILDASGNGRDLGANVSLGSFTNPLPGTPAEGAVRLLGSTFDTNSGTKSVVATPAVGDLTVLICAHSDNTSTALPTDTQSGTYTLVESRLSATGNDKMTLWVRTALIPSAISTTFSHAPGTSTGGGLVVLAVSGMTHVGAAAVRQSAGLDNQAAQVPEVTLGMSPVSTNVVLGAVFSGLNPATLTPPSGWTEQVDVGYLTPERGLEVCGVSGGQTAALVPWGSSTSSDFAALVMELNTSSVRVIDVGETFTTTSGTKTLVATPAVGNLIILICAHSGNTSTAAPTDNNAGGGGTYTLVESRGKSTSADTMTLWVRNNLITSATSTTFSHAPGTTTGGGLWVGRVPGMSRVGAAAVRQSSGQSNSGAGAQSVFPAACLFDNPLITGLFTSGQSNPGTPANFTTVANLGYISPNTWFVAASRNNGHTSTTVTWSTVTIAQCCLAVELDASAAGVSTPLGVSGGLSVTGTKQQVVGKALIGAI
jgi:hypothetical protein